MCATPRVTLDYTNVLFLTGQPHQLQTTYEFADGLRKTIGDHMTVVISKEAKLLLLSSEGQKLFTSHKAQTNEMIKTLHTARDDQVPYEQIYFYQRGHRRLLVSSGY